MSEKRVGEPEQAPEIITKKWVCVRLGISLRCGHRGEVLRQRVFTDDVLEQIGLSIEDYKRRRTFSRLESVKIKQVLHL